MGIEPLKDLADHIVDYGRSIGAAYVEARAQWDHVSSILVKNRNVEAGFMGDLWGVGIRVIVDGSMGFASLNRADRELARRRVREAVSLARASRPLGKRVRLSEEGASVERWGVREKVPLDDVPIEDKVELLFDADDGILSVKGAKAAARLLELTERRTEKYYANSDGCRITSRVPRVALEAVITMARGGDSEQGRVERGGSGGWEIVEGWGWPDECARKAGVLADILAEAKAPPVGRIDLILGSEIVGLAVHESAGHPYEADRILGREAAQAGESFITADMLGTRIGSDAVSVIDDPTVPGSYGYYECDDEGVRARPRYLIREGMINEFLHNRETAAELGVGSNAAARASEFDKEPLVRMATTYMAPGDRDVEELIEGVRTGAFVRSYEEWNIDDLRFNMRFVGSEAYLIEGGELKGLIRRPVIEMTTPAFYGKIDALTRQVELYPGTCGKGDPVQGLPVWFGGPTIRLRGVRLGV